MSVGITQLLLVLLLVMILFGAGKLPRVMSDLGKGMRNFRQAMNDNEQNITNNDSNKDR